MSDAECAEWLRRDGPPPGQRELYFAWLSWWRDRATALAENENRLRGALWCLAALRRAYEANKGDAEAIEAGRRTRELLREVWRIPDPPIGPRERNELAKKVVTGL